MKAAGALTAYQIPGRSKSAPGSNTAKVGGITISTPNIPYLPAGGIVPGVPGSDVPAILQAGVLVIPRSEATALRRSRSTSN
jgi:hypothetical protein